MHRSTELSVGHRATARPIDQCNFILELSRRTEDEVGERNFRDGDVRIWTAKDHVLSGTDFSLCREKMLQRSAMFIAYEALLDQTLSQER